MTNLLKIILEAARKSTTPILTKLEGGPRLFRVNVLDADIFIAELEKAMTDHLSNFVLHTPKEKQKQILEEAVKRAGEEQRKAMGEPKCGEIRAMIKCPKRRHYDFCTDCHKGICPACANETK